MPSNGKLISFGGLAGVLGPVIALSLVFYSVYISSWFTWSGNSLSDLGVHSAAIYFNSGLIVEGILNVPFAVGIAAAFSSRAARTVNGIMFGISGASLGFVGVFTEHSGSLHATFALAFFILFPLSLMVFSLTNARRHPAFSILTFLMGIAALIAIFLTPHQSGALAIPEILEAVILSAWSIGTGLFMLIKGRLPVKAQGTPN